MSGIYVPDQGKINSYGSKILLHLGVGFAPQLTGLENIYINAYILGLNKKEIQAIEADIIHFSELGDWDGTKTCFFYCFVCQSGYSFFG